MKMFFFLSLGFFWMGLCPVQALVFDNEDISVGYTMDSDKATTDNRIVLTQGQTGQAVQLNYNFNTTDSWVQMKKDFSVFSFAPLHVANTKVRFYYRLWGSNNKLLFQLTDTNGVKVFKRINTLVNNGSWQEVSIPITDLTGFGSFDLYNVNKIEVALEKDVGGSGTLDIDKIELIRSSEQVNASQLLDNFDGGTGSPNQFNGAQNTYTSDGNASISVTYDNSAGNVYAGAYSLKLNYNAGTLANVENAGFYSSPGGADLSGYRQIEFYAKASNDNEAFTLRFGSAIATEQSLTVGGIGKTWQKVVIPFENYNTIQNSGANGKNGFFKVTEFVFVFSQGLSAGSGNLWVDDVRFVRPSAAAGVLKSVDEFEENTDLSLTNWGTAADATAAASLNSITDGLSGRAMRMNYNFGSAGGWCTMYKNFYINASLTDSIRFKYKYSGTANNFEFHLLDSGNVHFWAKMPDVTDTGGTWKTMTFPFQSLLSYSGGTTLNLRNLKEMRFTLTKNTGGKGIFAIEDLEILNAPKVTLGDSGSLIENLTVDNNPFSPNGDGVKDTATFSYTLKEEAYIRLRIYDSDGSVIREFKYANPVPAGPNSIIWDGTDSNGSRANNGLCFYQFGAESVSSGDKDKLTNLIAVLR